jgi:hypothetical protein
MRVVRTIGQAFEVCHKVVSILLTPFGDKFAEFKAQEQMQEKGEEGDSGSTSRGRSKRGKTIFNMDFY